MGNDSQGIFISGLNWFLNEVYPLRLSKNRVFNVEQWAESLRLDSGHAVVEFAQFVKVKST